MHEKSNFIWQKSALSLVAGGKPSTWFPPGRLVEHPLTALAVMGGVPLNQCVLVGDFQAYLFFKKMVTLVGCLPYHRGYRERIHVSQKFRTDFLQGGKIVREKVSAGNLVNYNNMWSKVTHRSEVADFGN